MAVSSERRQNWYGDFILDPFERFQERDAVTHAAGCSGM